MSRQKKRIIIFGVGQLLNEYIKELDIDEIVAFIDNDFNKLYQTIYGRIVVQPSRIMEFSFDYVVIFNQKHSNQIHEQLIQLGVDDSKIINWQYYVYIMKRNVEVLSRTVFSAIYDLVNKLDVDNALDIESGIARNGLYIAGTDMRNCFAYVDDYCTLEHDNPNVYNMCIRSLAPDRFYDIIFCLDYYINHTVEELQDLIKKTYSHSQYILITIPYSCPNDWTEWSEIDFSKYGTVLEASGRTVKLILIKKNIIKKYTKSAVIYTVAHKKFEPPKNKLFIPIFVGNAQESALDALRDSVGDNISGLNPVINELTALYWVWKNTCTDIVGMCHYRRYFSVSPEFVNMEFSLLSQDKIEDELKIFDMIVSNAISAYPFSLEEQLRKTVNPAAFDTGMSLIRGRIMEVCPEYLKEFDSCFKGFIMYPCNMFITTWDRLSEFCEWLFGIIIDVARKADVTMYDSYSQRIIGFIAERLLTVWIKYNRVRVKEYPVIIIN